MLYVCYTTHHACFLKLTRFPSRSDYYDRIHHDKHHATYVANINKATEGKDEVPILDLMESAIEAGPGFRNSGT
jgi:superoxide dismutase